MNFEDRVERALRTFKTLVGPCLHLERVPAAEVDVILSKVFDARLAARGFHKIAPRKWVRSAKPEIREVFQVLAMKGASYSPVWGFSLDYVPHISGASLQWHRTSRSAYLDLRYDPLDYVEPPSREFEAWFVHTFYGRRKTTNDAVRVARIAFSLATAFFNQVLTINDLPKAFEQQIKLTQEGKVHRFGFYNYIQHPIAYALTLAKLGQLSKAESVLERAIARGDTYRPVAAQLRAHLGELARTASERHGANPEQPAR